MLQNESFKIQMARIQIVDGYKSPGTPVNIYGVMSSDWNFISCGYKSAHTVLYKVSSYSITILCFTATQDELNLIQLQFFHNHFTVINFYCIFKN